MIKWILLYLFAGGLGSCAIVMAIATFTLVKLGVKSLSDIKKSIAEESIIVELSKVALWMAIWPIMTILVLVGLGIAYHDIKRWKEP